MPKELRPYQKETVELILDFLFFYSRIILNAKQKKRFYH